MSVSAWYCGSNVLVSHVSFSVFGEFLALHSEHVQVEFRGASKLVVVAVLTLSVLSIDAILYCYYDCCSYEILYS